MWTKNVIPLLPIKESLSTEVSFRFGMWFSDAQRSKTKLPHLSGNESAKNDGSPWKSFSGTFTSNSLHYFSKIYLYVGEFDYFCNI